MSTSSNLHWGIQELQAYTPALPAAQRGPRARNAARYEGILKARKTILHLYVLEQLLLDHCCCLLGSWHKPLAVSQGWTVAHCQGAAAQWLSLTVPPGLHLFPLTISQALPACPNCQLLPRMQSPAGLHPLHQRQLLPTAENEMMLHWPAIIVSHPSAYQLIWCILDMHLRYVYSSDSRCCAHAVEQCLLHCISMLLLLLIPNDLIASKGRCWLRKHGTWPEASLMPVHCPEAADTCRACTGCLRAYTAPFTAAMRQKACASSPHPYMGVRNAPEPLPYLQPHAGTCQSIRVSRMCAVAHFSAAADGMWQWEGSTAV